MIDFGFGNIAPILMILLMGAIIVLALWVLSILFPASPTESPPKVERKDPLDGTQANADKRGE